MANLFLITLKLNSFSISRLLIVKSVSTLMVFFAVSSTFDLFSSFLAAGISGLWFGEAKGAFQSVRDDTGTIDRVQTGVKGAEVRGHSAPRIQCQCAIYVKVEAEVWQKPS